MWADELSMEATACTGKHNDTIYDAEIQCSHMCMYRAVDSLDLQGWQNNSSKFLLKKRLTIFQYDN